MKTNLFKRFKTMTAAVLVLAMTLSLCVPVFASEETASGIVFEAEDYYSGNISEKVAADMQPGESITVSLPEDFVSEWYTLTVASCGNRTTYSVAVNDVMVATVSRAGTGFGIIDMTQNSADAPLALKAGDVITVAAPDDGTYGWLDYVRLDVYTGDIQNEDYFIYDAEDYYSGNISEEVAADMQPGETIAIALGSEFVAGKYTLTVSSCGNRESFEILVNDVSYSSIYRSGTGFGMDQMTLDKLENKILTLSAGDVITVVAPAEGYGWVDYVRLDAYIIDDALETQVDYYRYHAEAFYDTLPSTGDAAADMQPNTQFNVELAANGAFSAGKYILSVASCGNRESFEILVNGESMGTISRIGSDFGMNHMSTDALDAVLELSESDVITVVAPAEGYGWVDYVQLTKYLPAEATETGDGYYVYQTEYFYDGTINEEVAADMQPGETISLRLNANADFAAGEYWLTVYSCGDRESFDVLVNGERAGTISRTATGYGQDQMTYDKLETVLELKPDDVVSIAAPEEGYGWVDFIMVEKSAPDPMTEWGITLGDDVNVSFALSLTAEEAAEAEVEFMVDGVPTAVSLSNVQPDEQGIYKVSAKLAAAQMTSPVNVRIKIGNALAHDKSYTVRQYADVILNGDYTEQTKALVREMLHYGAAAQIYFGYRTDSLANAGVDASAKIAVPEKAPTEMALTGSVDGIAYYGATMVFASKNAVRYYFTATADITNYSFTVDGTAYKPVEKNGMYYVEIAEINPQDLDQSITLTVNDTLSVTYNPMNYMVRMSDKGSENMMALVEALYNYHLAAQTYVQA